MTEVENILQVLSIMMKYFVASSKKTLNIANSSRLEYENHTQFETKMTKIETLFLTKMSLKTTLFKAGHTPTAHIREYGPLSLGRVKGKYHK